MLSHKSNTLICAATAKHLYIHNASFNAFYKIGVTKDGNILAAKQPILANNYTQTCSHIFTAKATNKYSRHKSRIFFLRHPINFCFNYFFDIRFLSNIMQIFFVEKKQQQYPLKTLRSIHIFFGVKKLQVKSKETRRLKFGIG